MLFKRLSFFHSATLASLFLHLSPLRRWDSDFKHHFFAPLLGGVRARRCCSGGLPDAGGLSAEEVREARLWRGERAACGGREGADEPGDRRQRVLNARVAATANGLEHHIEGKGVEAYAVGAQLRKIDMIDGEALGLQGKERTLCARMREIGPR